VTDLPSLPPLPGEVVTRALVRIIDLRDDRRAALITLDNGLDHTRPNTFGPAGLAELSAALDAVQARADLAAVFVTGKPYVFGVGADLTGVPLLTDRDSALALARLGHDVFRRFGELDVPSFAFVNGVAMGGALELALHCTYRTVSAGAAALSLPECSLGLVPGWGGVSLLPRLVGPDAAVGVIVENPLSQNRQLQPKQAVELGIADRMFAPADFLEESIGWAAQVISGQEAVERRAVDADPAAWKSAVERGRGIADARTRGFSPAPYRALELIERARTAGRDEAFAAEDDALADLIMSDEFRAGLYAFDLVQRRARRPAGAPDSSHSRPVTKVGVVGSGLMATQLALLFAWRLEVPVVITDLDSERVDAGLARIGTEIDASVAKRRLDPDRANRLRGSITGTTRLDDFADADWVIEAVFEDLSVKQQVFADLEKVVGDSCVLATNTSSLSVSEMASGLAHPERVVGFHFFNPVAVLPLLEVVRADRTDEATLATAFAVGRRLKKSCVLVSDAPGFVFNRLISRALGEVLAAIDAGTPVAVADASVAALGMPLSPTELVGLVGPAVALHTGESLQRAFPDRFAVSATLRALAESTPGAVSAPSTDPARRSDRSVDPDPDDDASPDSEGADQDVRAQAAAILDRARRALAEEIRIMLDDGVVAAPEDVDLCLLLGGGWAFWNGGITPYLDRTGVSEAVTGRRFLAPGVASVPVR
jgi:3-hydroxyacyl-CoA dehydrogenase/enoyl-CoA hydratase/carnithine racemase